MHDLIVKNASLIDGLGTPRYHADVAVSHGKIAAIGKDLGSAAQVINADGLALAPGIIDTHTHYDAQITWDPMASPSPALGVTTCIIGNCGFTIAPARQRDRDRIMRNLTQVEGMSLAALRAGIKWDFETFPQYLQQLDSQGVGVNVAAFVGHSSVRTYVLGEEASVRAATPTEVDEMHRIVVDALQAGAIGFSTTTAEAHNGEGGIPMPSRLADRNEMARLVGALGETKRGVFMITKGATTSVPYLESLGAATERPVVVAALLHDNQNPDAVFQDLRDIGAACERGRNLVGAVACTPLTFEFTLRSPYPLEGLRAWQQAFRTSAEELPRVIADAGFRARVKEELATPINTRVFNGEWHLVSVCQVAKQENLALEGQRISDLAKAAGKDPLDWMFDFALSENLETYFFTTTKNSDEAALKRLILHPRSMVSLSDAGAHLTFLCDAGFGLHMLGHWARDSAALNLEQAVQKITSYPAKVYGLQQRGYLKAGAWADMMLFDPATVGRGSNRRTWDLPAGASRISTTAKGLHAVWVNGERVVNENGLRDDAARRGQVLRSFNA